MSPADETCWTLIRDAAGGRADARSGFAVDYLPVVRAYLGARWSGGPLAGELDDAVQDVFIECLRADGALSRVDPEKPGRFRTFLFAVTRNVARRCEESVGRRRVREVKVADDPDDLPADDPRLSRIFDRAWADRILKRAVARLKQAAEERGPEAKRRVQLLVLRFAEGLPIREIADRWDEDPAIVHRQYARARNEFKDALAAEVAFHHPGTPGEIQRECRALLELIGS
jgi:RNA polymerase sigma-70 factor (ECF subfamily)